MPSLERNARALSRGIAALLLCAAGTAKAAPPTIDAVVPAQIKNRLYLGDADVGALGNSLEPVVCYFGMLKDGKLEVASIMPDSFGSGSALVGTKLEDGKAGYDAVVTSTKDVNAGIPILSLTLANNQKAEVSFTDTARVECAKSPNMADWEKLPVAAADRTWVFINTATVSVVRSTILTETTSGIAGLIQAFTVGAKTYNALDGSSSVLAVSLFVKKDPRKLANLPAGLLQATRSQRSLSDMANQ